MANSIYDGEEMHLRNKLPRSYNYAQRPSSAALMFPGGGGVAPNRFQAENALNTQYDADFRANAPPRRPEWFKAMLPGTAPGSMTITLDKGQEPAETLPTDKVSIDAEGRKVITRQGTQRLQPNLPGIAPDVDQTAMARRDAYVNKQRNLANYQYPGMQENKFASDANARANSESAAKVGEASANANYVLPGMGAAYQSDAAVKNAQAATATGMLPGQITAQGTQNKLNERMIDPTVAVATTAAANPPAAVSAQQIKQLTALVTQHQKDNAALRAENDRLMQQVRLYQQPKGNATDRLLEEVANDGQPKSATPAPVRAPTTQPVQQVAPVQQTPANIGTPTPQPAQYQIGQTATDHRTGQKMKYTANGWEPM